MFEKCFACFAYSWMLRISWTGFEANGVARLSRNSYSLRRRVSKRLFKYWSATSVVVLMPRRFVSFGSDFLLSCCSRVSLTAPSFLFFYDSEMGLRSRLDASDLVRRSNYSCLRLSICWNWELASICSWLLVKFSDFESIVMSSSLDIVPFAEPILLPKSQLDAVPRYFACTWILFRQTSIGFPPSTPLILGSDLDLLFNTRLVFFFCSFFLYAAEGELAR